MRTFVGLLIAVVLAASGAAAQDPSTRFHSGVDLVGLNVVVTDPQGHLVSGLARTDFAVLIAEELSKQYLVGYAPKNPLRDGSYRRVSVRIDRPGIRARTRAGYVATPLPASASR